MLLAVKGSQESQSNILSTEMIRFVEDSNNLARNEKSKPVYPGRESRQTAREYSVGWYEEFKQAFQEYGAGIVAVQPKWDF